MTEAQLRIDGMKAFDYTQWRQNLWGDITLDELWELGQKRAGNEAE